MWTVGETLIRQFPRVVRLRTTGHGLARLARPSCLTTLRSLVCDREQGVLERDHLLGRPDRHPQPHVGADSTSGIRVPHRHAPARVRRRATRSRSASHRSRPRAPRRLGSPGSAPPCAPPTPRGSDLEGGPACNTAVLLASGASVGLSIPAANRASPSAWSRAGVRLRGTRFTPTSMETGQFSLDPPALVSVSSDLV